MGIHSPLCRFLYTLEVPRLGGKPLEYSSPCQTATTCSTAISR